MTTLREALPGLFPTDAVFAFDEAKHPRDHGKFAEKPGAEGTATAESGWTPELQAIQREMDEVNATSLRLREEAIREKDPAKHKEATRLRDTEKPRLRREFYDALPGPEAEAPSAVPPEGWADGEATRFKAGPGRKFYGPTSSLPISEAEVGRFFPDGIPGHHNDDLITESQQQREELASHLRAAFPDDPGEIKRLVVTDNAEEGWELDSPGTLLGFATGHTLVIMPDGESSARSFAREVRDHYDRATSAYPLTSQKGLAQLFRSLGVKEEKGKHRISKRISNTWEVSYSPGTSEYRLRKAPHEPTSAQFSREESQPMTTLREALPGLFPTGDAVFSSPRLRLSGPTHIIATLATTCRLLGLAYSFPDDHASFEWVKDRTTRRKNPSPNRYVWNPPTTPPKIKYSKTDPNKGRAPRKDQAVGRESIDDLAAHLSTLDPGDITPEFVTDLAESICKDYTRAELRTLATKLGWSKGAKLKSQLALDVSAKAAEEAESRKVESPTDARKPEHESTDNIATIRPRHDVLGIAPSDLASIHKWAKAADLTLSPDDEQAIVGAAASMASKGKEALNPGHLTRAFEGWKGHFTGKDRLGRQWEDGKLVAKGEKNTPTESLSLSPRPLLA